MGSRHKKTLAEKKETTRSLIRKKRCGTGRASSRPYQIAGKKHQPRVKRQKNGRKRLKGALNSKMKIVKKAKAVACFETERSNKGGRERKSGADEVKEGKACGKGKKSASRGHHQDAGEGGGATASKGKKKA